MYWWILIVYDASGNRGIFMGATESASNLHFGIRNSEKMRITYDGKVGIGTDTVTRGPLHIHEPSTSDCQIHLTNNNTGTTSSDGLTIFTGQSNGDCGFVSRESGGSIEFYTHNGSSVGQRLRITSAGNVGINDTAPSQKLVLVVT